MKAWQVILINAFVTVLAVFAAVGLFAPDTPPDKSKEIREALDQQIKGIQLKLNAIEAAVVKQKECVSITTAPSESGKNSEDLSKLGQKLDMILGKLSVLENQGTRVQAPQSFGRSFGPSPIRPPQLPPAISARGQKPSSWIDRLPDNKKQEVQIILEEHSARMREKLPLPNPDGSIPDRDTIKNIMIENDLQLKQELKVVLSDEEYQDFLDSHLDPSSFQAPTLPGIQENE